MVAYRPSLASAQKSWLIPRLPETQDDSKADRLKDLIVEIAADLQELRTYYNISLSLTRVQRIGEYLSARRNELVTRYFPFEDLDPQARVDWLLIQGYTKREQANLHAEWDQIKDLEPLIGGWAKGLVELCEKRQKVTPVSGKDAAQVLSDAEKVITRVSTEILKGHSKMKDNRFGAYRAAFQIEELQSILAEWYSFYAGYDPLFTWWTSKPWEDLSKPLSAFVALIRKHLVGINPGEEDAIVGQPIGAEAIHAELGTEVIAYPPKELIQIAEKQYAWCEREAIQASREMGFGDDWKAAQEKVKNMYVEPGQQTYMVHELANEAIEYVTKHDMVTLPQIAKECWRTDMMSPARQRVNPFFLGGTEIIVSYPTDTMSHDEKLMSMRGNNRPFSRSTVFHELLPGHHLQYHYQTRSKPYRRMFETPFWIEGWAFYWELILWDRGFPGTPENRLGMLFWHMHRCMRIVFSLKFHLGLMTPQECIDLLVEKVGHERATAEGEVRRSFNGDYGALYQAGYMLGALQLYALRKEIVDDGKMPEKEFHDFILKQNSMPIEYVRALLKGQKLEANHQPSWKFYDL